MSINSSRHSKSEGSLQPRLGSGIKLTAEFLAMKTRMQLHQIKKLNLWGQELRDVSIFQSCPNLEVVALTVNQIDTLQDFQGLENLQELYLRRNQIPADMNELQYLSGLRNLRVLNLAENPLCAERGGISNYRSVILKFLPQLQKLDDIPVTQQDVAQAQQINLNKIAQNMNNLATVEEIDSNYSLQKDLKEIKYPKKNQSYHKRQIQKQELEPVNKASHANHSKKSKVPGSKNKNGNEDIPTGIFKPLTRNLKRTPMQQMEKETISESYDTSENGNNKISQFENQQSRANRDINGGGGVKWMYGGQQSNNNSFKATPSSRHRNSTPVTEQFSMQTPRIVQYQQKLMYQKQEQQYYSNQPVSSMPECETSRISKTGSGKQQYPTQRQNGSGLKSSNRRTGFNTSRMSEEQNNLQKKKERILSSKLQQQTQPKLKKKKKSKNENILCAIVALMNELDKKGLEFVMKDANKRVIKMIKREEKENLILEHSAQFGMQYQNAAGQGHFNQGRGSKTSTQSRKQWVPQIQTTRRSSQPQDLFGESESDSDDISQKSLEQVLSEFEEVNSNYNSDMD